MIKRFIQFTPPFILIAFLLSNSIAKETATEMSFGGPYPVITSKYYAIRETASTLSALRSVCAGAQRLDSFS